MADPISKVRFVTFYSYKGGVGRTMALANVACRLANLHGKHVVCVDWDLEAPGLHFYFGFDDRQLAGRTGLLDYLNDFKWQQTQGSKGRRPRVADYLLDLLPERKEKIKYGSVRVMHCGRTEPNFVSRVQAFDWDVFYEKYAGFRVVEQLKADLIEEAGADIVLVDARAGQAEIGTTPTIQIPDAVVLLYTANKQSLEGTERIAREIHGHPLRREAGGAPRIILVASRIFPQEEKFDAWAQQHVRPVWDRLIADGIISKIDHPRGPLQYALPIDPKWSVPELLPMLDAPTGTTDSRTPELNRAYALLAQAIDNMHRGQELAELDAPRGVWARPEITVTEQIIARAAQRGDEAEVARGQISLGKSLLEQGKLEEAAANFQAALTYGRRAGDPRIESASRFYLGRILLMEGRYEEAWEMVSPALMHWEQEGELHEQPMVLDLLGRIRIGQDRFDDAWQLEDRAYQLAIQLGDALGMSVTQHQKGCIRQKQKRYAEAAELFGTALTLARQTSDRHWESATHYQIAHLLFEAERYDDAWVALAAALKLVEETGDLHMKGLALSQMGLVRTRQRRYEEGLELAQRAVAVFEPQNYSKGVRTGLERMAEALRALGRIDELRQIEQRLAVMNATDELPPFIRQPIVPATGSSGFGTH